MIDAAAKPSPLSPRALLAPSAKALAVTAIVLSFLLPEGGLGVDLCMLHALTGLPCPGCGLSRAFIALADGEVALAVGANPFVLLLYPLFLALAALALLPRRWTAPLEDRLVRNSYVARGYRLLIAAFIGFGLARCTVFLALGERFP